MRRIRSIAAALCCAVLTAVTPAQDSLDAANWIVASCRTSDGALTVRPHGEYVSPYFGNITARGLVAARLHLDVVREWMVWYVAHAHGSGSGVDGVPDDVRIMADGTSVSRGRPDSTDAYGATFLMLARAAFETGDPAIQAFIHAHAADMRRIGNSTIATQQPNGLTWARPQHRIAYAIDNEQVYRGLLDGAALEEEAFGDTLLAQQWRAHAVAVLDGLNIVLWDSNTQSYRPSVTERGEAASADLTRVYPDALAQLFAIVYGVVDARSFLAASLLARASTASAQNGHGDTVEYTLVLALAGKNAGSDVTVPSLNAPPLCPDAGWELTVAHPSPAHP